MIVVPYEMDADALVVQVVKWQTGGTGIVIINRFATKRKKNYRYPLHLIFHLGRDACRWFDSLHHHGTVNGMLIG
jgi:hypothetical protein